MARKRLYRCRGGDGATIRVKSAGVVPIERLCVKILLDIDRVLGRSESSTVAALAGAA
jgi:hypothetical protein